MHLKLSSFAPTDLAELMTVAQAAFPGPEEAELSKALLERADSVVCLVAKVDARLVGFILFSAVELQSAEGFLLGLAPLAVHPDYQNQKIGHALTEAGLAACHERGAKAVFVLGHPNYYPRFGFSPAHKWGITCEFPSDPEVFMALEFTPGALEGKAGELKYHPVFRELFGS